MFLRRLHGVAALAAATATMLGLAACGDSDSAKKDSAPASSVATADQFPSAKGKTLAEIRKGLGPGPVLAPTVSVLRPGENRFGFGLFDRSRKQIAMAPVAVYVEEQGTGKVSGPYPARDLSLEVKPAFRSETVSRDADAAKSLYVADLNLPKAGDYALLGVVKLDDRLVTSDPVGIRVPRKSGIPDVGDPAPRVDTPTRESAGGNVKSIDTRVPPSTMHDVNLADALGKKPVVLLFATPALCQSRVCGPVVDIAEEVKAEHKGEADFIHMEIFRNNEIGQGCLEGQKPAKDCFRPQVLAYGLPTEPWLFAIDARGKVAARLEGAYSKAELEAALKKATKG
jgi:hypothetical protein